MDDDEVSRKELEKRLRKMVQREVIKLLNAVSPAEIKREEGAELGRAGGCGDCQKGEERYNKYEADQWEPVESQKVHSNTSDQGKRLWDIIQLGDFIYFPPSSLTYYPSRWLTILMDF